MTKKSPIKGQSMLGDGLIYCDCSNHALPGPGGSNRREPEAPCSFLEVYIKGTLNASIGETLKGSKISLDANCGKCSVLAPGLDELDRDAYYPGP